MSKFKCEKCGATKEGKCKPQKCSKCGASGTMKKEEAACGCSCNC